MTYCKGHVDGARGAQHLDFYKKYPMKGSVRPEHAAMRVGYFSDLTQVVAVEFGKDATLVCRTWVREASYSGARKRR